MIAAIDRLELQVLIAAGTATVVDALPQSYFDQQHLPGAVNLLEADIESQAATLLPDRTVTTAPCAPTPAVSRTGSRLDCQPKRQRPQLHCDSGETAPGQPPR